MSKFDANFRRYWVTDAKEIRAKFSVATMANAHLDVLREAESQKRLMNAVLLCTPFGTYLEELALYEGPISKMGQ
jgi:hypothetical protein